MPSNFGCSLLPDPDKDNARNRKFPSSMRNRVRARMEQLDQRLLAGATTPPSRAASAQLDDASRNTITSRVEWALHLGRTISESPDSWNNLEALFAQLFGVERNLAGLGSDYTAPGAVRRALIEAKHLLSGATRNVLADIEFGSTLKKVNQVFDQVLRETNLTRAQREALKLDLMEVGWHPYLQTHIGFGPQALLEAQTRQQEVLARATRAGISEADMDRLAAGALEAANKYQEVLEVVQAAGIVIDGVQDINYVERAFSPQAKRYIYNLADKYPDLALASGLQVRTPNKFFSAFAIGRETFHYVVEDGAVLEYVLKYHNAWPDGVTNVEELFLGGPEGTQRLGRAIFNGLPARLQTTLIDSGLISKLPMTSTEVYEFLREAFDLPFKEVSEMLSTDFELTARLYANQLQEIAGRSGIVRAVVGNSVDGKWGVSGAMVRAEPERYQNYTKLIRRDDGVGAEILNRMGLNDPAIKDTYVHRVVANMFNGMLEVGTSPTNMGMLSQLLEFVRDFNSGFRRQALMTTGFLQSNIIGAAAQSWMAGGDLINFIDTQMRGHRNLVDAYQTGKPLSESFPSTWDDTARRYKHLNPATGQEELLTEAGLWRELTGMGYLEYVMPWTGDNFLNNYKQQDAGWRSFERQLRYTYHSFTTFDGNVANPQDLGRYIGKQVETNLTGNLLLQQFDTVMYQFQLQAALNENLAKFALIKDLTAARTYRSDPIGQFRRDSLRALQQGYLGRQRTVAEAVEYSRQFFHDYSTVGSFDEWMRDIMPFWVYISRNQMAVTRWAIRNPAKFVAWNRIYAAMNSRVEDDGDDLPYGGVSDWQRATRPVLWRRKDDGEYFALFTRSYDPIGDATQTVAEVGDGLQQLFGFWPDARYNPSLEDIPGQPYRNPVGKAFRTLVENSYGYARTAVGLISNEDPLTGREFNDGYDAFLGIPMPSWLRFTVESNFPVLSNINRANWGSMFGRAPYIDSQGNVSRGVLSWWGTERAQRDVVSDYRDMKQRILQTAGVRVYTIDTIYNMGRTEAEIGIALSNLEKEIGRETARLPSIVSPERRAAREHELAEMTMQTAMLREELRAIYYWRQERGLSPSGARSWLLNNELRRDELPQVPDAELYNILKQTLDGTTPPQLPPPEIQPQSAGTLREPPERWRESPLVEGQPDVDEEP